MWWPILVPFSTLLWMTSTSRPNCELNMDLEVFVLQDGTSSFRNRLELSPAIVSGFGSQLKARYPDVRFGTALFSDLSRGSRRMECWVDLMRIGPSLDDFVRATYGYRPLGSNGDGTGLENSLGSLAHAAAGAAGFTPYNGPDNILRIVVIITDNPSWYGNETTPGYRRPDLGRVMNCEADYASLPQVAELSHANGVYPVILNPTRFFPWWHARMAEIGFTPGTYLLQELRWQSNSQIYIDNLIEDIVSSVTDISCEIPQVVTTTTRPTTTVITTTTASTATTTTNTIPPLIRECCEVCEALGIVV
eukprot:Gregarina_sp_Poly_1__4675@NODE_2499_length_2056_cov_15_505279_g1588_i0_p1_GENE_NODE_2499_length_2056_cov_15_505279_g1588_i0NODE_2499_length_2056_cov_15_505279_g1588_i0_p1_ORF_typecomplete_len306_score20_24VWA/PF00092_28/0_0031Integrin_beta/PF00362_18/0_21DUF3439/PF11921_8/2_7_NODE_2499_length_2056_cov_15_505279_g1588_i05361453